MWYKRTYWTELIQRRWRRRTVIWLAGVRRAGKTVLCQSLEGSEYFDCELPSVRRMLRDPEMFFDRLRGKTVVLDETHRLPDPSGVLKIAADHYPDVRVLATGSSTLAASRKFRDTLAGRREQVWLTPMIHRDLEDFGQRDLGRRLLRGGLPPFFLGEDVSERDFQDWLDSYWAKDLEELFRLERRDSFLHFTELLLARSGGIFEAAGYVSECGVSHTTIRNYLAVLEDTFVAHTLRPYSLRAATELVRAPKVYGFDTGFVCLARRWRDLGEQETGLLWEHYVLNEIHGRLQTRRLHYWRDKRGHEVDLVFPLPDGRVTAVECKVTADSFDAANLRSFRRRHPAGDNLVVAPDVRRGWSERRGDLVIRFTSLPELVDELRSVLGSVLGEAAF